MSDLITTARAQEIPALAGVDAAYLASLISAASAALERYTKRTFALTSHPAEHHDGDGGTLIFLDNFPVTELVSVTVVEPGGTEVEMPGSDFDVEGGTGEIRFKSAASAAYRRFPKGFRNVKAAYTAGFATVPEPVQEACAQYAAWLYSSASRAGGVAAEKLGDYSSRFERGDREMLPRSVRELLGPYRNVRV